MVDIQWEDPPEVALVRTRGAGGKYLDFAVALRDHPGRWAVLPTDAPRTVKGAAATGQNIRRGKVKGFDKGLYETAVQDTKVWVRYNPPEQPAEAPQGDTGGQAATDKPKPADVRAWATKQGIEVPDRGRLPDDVLERYSSALAKGEVGLPLRVLREDDAG